MHAGTITWNSLDLSGLGTPRIAISQQADPPAPAQPTRQLTTLKVTVHLHAMDPATIQARLERLQASMRVADGILQSSMGSGHAMSWHAVPGSNNLMEVLGGTTNTVELGFSAVENHEAGAFNTIQQASFTPAGSADPIILHAVRGQGETIATDRHSARASARRATTHTLTFIARIAQANPADPYSTRLAWLQAQADGVNSLDTREGTLVLGALNRIVRVTEMQPKIDEGAGVLDLQVQCFYVVLPDAAKAEANFEIRTRDDAGTGETVITLAGTIEAETRAIALAKLSQIRSNHVTSGRRASSYETQDRVIDGADTEGVTGADWTGALNFTLELREPRSGSHYQLKITSTKDIRAGMRWTYSGSVMAASENAALATARALPPTTGLPVRVRAEESIERMTDAVSGGDKFVKLDFSYEYEGPADGFIGGEISTDLAKPEFAEHRKTISGFLVAADKATAEAKLNLLLPSTENELELTTKWTDTYLQEGVEKRTFQKLEFSASYRMTHGGTSVKYQDTTSQDLTAMQRTREVSGSIWAATEGAANSALETLITSLFGTAKPQRRSSTSHKEIYGNAQTGWAQLDFQLGRTDKLTGEVGHDIIEASLTIERLGGLNANVIKTIPYGTPIVQTNTGMLPGKVTITATCKARVKSTAISWVQGKRALATGSKHETDQPRESLAPEFAPFSGTDVTLYVFTGTYGFSYVAGMEGTWSGDLGDL